MLRFDPMDLRQADNNSLLYLWGRNDAYFNRFLEAVAVQVFLVCTYYYFEVKIHKINK